MNYAHLQLEERKEHLFVWLNRPEVHNAFNDELIAEAIDLFSTVDTPSAVPRASCSRAPARTSARART